MVRCCYSCYFNIVLLTLHFNRPCFISICFLNVDMLMLIYIELLERLHYDVMYYNQILWTKGLYVFYEVQNAFISLPSSKKKQWSSSSGLQLDHRILATASLVSIGTLWWSTRKLEIHPAVRSLIGSTFGMAAVQVFFFPSMILWRLFEY